MQLNRDKLADFLGCSLRTVDEYVRGGMPGEAPRRKGDQWRFDSAAAVSWLRERERSAVLGEIAKVDEGEAKRRKLAADAAQAEFNLAEAQGKAISIREWVIAGEQMVGAARAKLLGLGARLGRAVATVDDPAECAALIDSAVHEALYELSEFEPRIPIDTEGDPPLDGGDVASGETLGAAAGPDRKRVGGQRAQAKQRK